MSSILDLLTSFQDKSKIELNETTKLIETTIKNTFDSIQSQLMFAIKNSTRDELITKLSNQKDDDLEICKIELKKDAIINKYLNNKLFKKDEYLITYQEYCTGDSINFIAYSNYNIIYCPQWNCGSIKNITQLSYSTTVKLPNQIISLVKKLWTEVLKIHGLGGMFGNHNDARTQASIAMYNVLCNVLPTIMYEFVQNFFGIDKFGVYGIEELINQFNQMKKELDNKNIKLKNTQLEIIQVKDDNDKLKKELEEVKLKNIQIKKELDDNNIKLDEIIQFKHDHDKIKNKLKKM